MSTATVALIRSIGGLVFDGTFREDHVSELEVTDNPVETGVVVSDNAFMKPLRVTVSAGVSDITLYPTQNFASNSSRSQEAFRLLQELQATAEPFDVQTGLKLYHSMVLSKLSAPQDKDSDTSLLFTAELREVIIVNTQTVTYPPRAAGATTRAASPKVTKGAQQGTQVPPGNTKSSLLTKLLGMGG